MSDKRSFILSCESTADLPAELIREKNISVLSYTCLAEGEVYRDGPDLPPTLRQKFYRLLENGVHPSTSQINSTEYLEYFESLPADRDILHIVFGSGMTGSICGARIAREEFLERHPGRRLEVIDSLASSAGYGLTVLETAEWADSGLSLDETAEKLMSLRTRVHHWFFCTDLDYHRRSGRVSNLSAAVGTLLNICPIMRLNREGRIMICGKARGIKKAAAALAEEMLRHAESGKDYSGPCLISYSGCRAYAEQLKNQLESLFDRLKGRVVLCEIGPVIASNCGPGNCALFYIGDERV